MSCQMDSDKDWIEAILLKKSIEEAPRRVLSLEKSDAVCKGENYSSKTSRITANVILGSGKEKKISLFVKNRHESEFLKKMTIDCGLFVREINMYRDIFPKMERLLEEIDDTADTLWVKCYDIRTYDRLVLEDLTLLGYKMADRKQQLGLEDAILVLKSIAKFHALSKVLLERGEIPMDQFGKHSWYQNERSMGHFFTENLRKLIVVMENWGDEWKEAVERLKKSLPDFGSNYLKAFSAEPTEFTVLNHGDCWTNNLLFRYGDDPDHPTSVKFVDWQISYVSVPSRDIWYFLMSSVRLEVRERYFDRLLESYCDALTLNLVRLNYEGPILDLPSLKEMAMKRLILPLCESFSFVPTVLNDGKHTPDMEKLVKDVQESSETGTTLEAWNPLEHMSSKNECIIKSIVKQAMEANAI